MLAGCLPHHGVVIADGRDATILLLRPCPELSAVHFSALVIGPAPYPSGLAHAAVDVKVPALILV